MPYGFSSYDDRVFEFYRPLADRAPHLLRAAARLEDLQAGGQSNEEAIAAVRAQLGSGDRLTELGALVLLTAYDTTDAAPPGRRMMAAVDELGGLTYDMSLPLAHPRVDLLFLYLLWLAKPLPETVRAGPAFLDRFSESMVDTLIDVDCLPKEWDSRLGESERADHLRSRLDIESFSDDELVDLEAWDELARRVRLGRSRAQDLPAEAVERDALVRAARTDDEALVRLAASAGLDADLLAAALAGRAVPGWSNLPDQSLLVSLLDRAPLNIPALDGGAMDLEQSRFASCLGVRNAKRALHEWDWHRALAEAGAVLGFAQDDWRKQEAALLCAGAQLQLGRPDRAHATLERVWNLPMTIDAAVDHGIAARAAGRPERASAALCLAAESLTGETETNRRLRTAYVREAVRAERAERGTPSERLAANIDKLSESLNGRLPEEIRDFSAGRAGADIPAAAIEQRNPYFILATDHTVDAEADRENAYRAYPAVRRRIRETDRPAFSLDDLDWALGFAEHHRFTVARGAQVFRIPTNQNAYRLFGDRTEFKGILSDLPRHLPRRTARDHVEFEDLKGQVWSAIHALHLSKMAE